MRLRLALIALTLMWIASISQEPGGLTAFASEVASIEEVIGAGAVHLDEKIAESTSPEVVDGNQVVRYFDGVLCERPRDEVAGDPSHAGKEHCETIVGVDAGE